MTFDIRCQRVQHLAVQVLGLLVADGRPAHHWQAAGRHEQEAEAYRALLLHGGMPVWR